MSSILIIGMGNPIMKDDSIGPRIVEDIKYKFSQVDFKTLSLGGFAIIDHIQGYETVIFIDAIKKRGGIPGTVYEFGIKNFTETANLSSFHDISFPVAIEFGKKIGLPMPKNILILAIEIVEDMVFEEGLSPELQEKYSVILEKVSNHVERYICEVRSY